MRRVQATIRECPSWGVGPQLDVPLAGAETRPVRRAIEQALLERAPPPRVGRQALRRDLDAHLVNGCFGVRVDLVPLLRDDRDLADLVEEPFGEAVDLGGCRAAACKNAEVHTHLDAGLRLFDHERERWINLS
jgi:hypothetical protein